MSAMSSIKKRQRVVKKPKKSSSSLFSSMGPAVRSEEKKNIDVNQFVTITVASPVWTTPLLLNPCAQGDTSSTRSGRQLELKSLYMRYVWALATTSTGGSKLRICIVYDKQANAAAPLVTDIFQTDNHISPNNLGNSQRFIMLVDELTEPVAAGTSFSVSGVIYRKLKNAITQFNSSTTGTIADINSGSLYLLASQSTNVLTTAPTFAIYSRVRFTDA